MQQCKSEAKNWCAPVFCEKDIQSVDPLCQCETKKIMETAEMQCCLEFCILLLLYQVTFCSSWCFNRLFLYESNTICASSYRLYFYSMMHTWKSRYKNDFAFHQCRSKRGQTTAGIGSRHRCAGFSWLDGIQNSHVCHSLFKHLVNMYQIVQFTIHPENWEVWHCLEFTV